MEWVETTAKTVDEAKELALDRLGVDTDEAEFQVIEEPKSGLFGRTRGQARVRARVAPRAPRPKSDRRDRRRGDRQKRSGDSKAATADSGRHGVESGGTAGDGRSPEQGGAEQSRNEAGEKPRRSKPRSGDGAKKARAPKAPEGQKEEATVTVTLDEQTDMAEEFLQGLLGAFGVEGDLARERIDDETAEIDVRGDDLGLLIGPRGQTITAVQELTRTVLQRRAGGSYEGRVRIDVSGYRQRRREALVRFTTKVAEEVASSGKSKALEPMGAADRKVVHDTVNDIDGVRTSSEGEEPRRWVVLHPVD